jgi:hypothetical protein
MTPKNLEKFKKGEHVYTELVVVTILSLVAASLWINWTKQFIYNIFQIIQQHYLDVL